MSAVQGRRISGGFILITGQDGIRYALRPNQVAVIHDADECQDEAVLRISLRRRYCQREQLDPLTPLVALAAPEPEAVPEYP